MKGLREPGWWTVVIAAVTLLCQGAAFVKLTTNDLAQIREAVERIETRMYEQDRAITDQKERLMKLEWERDRNGLSRSLNGMSREDGWPVDIRPPQKTGGNR